MSRIEYILIARWNYNGCDYIYIFIGEVAKATAEEHNQSIIDVAKETKNNGDKELAKV